MSKQYDMFGKEKIKCKECKKTFFKYNSQNIFCSYKCQKKYHKKLQKEKYKWKPRPKVKKLCKQCGKAFMGRIYSHWYCCIKCQHKYSILTREYRSRVSKFGKEIANLAKKFKACKFCDWSSNLHIHHINNNHNDDKLSNILVVCPNHHALLHSEGIEKYKPKWEKNIL